MKRHAPATSRNRGPILDVLRATLPATAGPARPLVIEIASGSGEHAVFFAEQLPHLEWQPTDSDPEALASIAAYAKEAQLDNLRAPLAVDVTDSGESGWAHGLAAAAIVCINMIHIAPWEACIGLVEGAARVLGTGGVLVLYGPYRFDGRFTSPSNEAFDASLRSRDPRWGVRDLGDVTRVAEGRGFVQERVVAMPANNHAVVFRRA